MYADYLIAHQAMVKCNSVGLECPLARGRAETEIALTRCLGNGWNFLFWSSATGILL